MAEDGQYVDGSIWFYAPNKGAPVFFAAAFLASAIVQTWQTIRYKCWKTTGVFIFATLIFTAGFIGREIAAFDYGDLIKYIVAVVLVYCAPPLFELGNYQVLSAILYYVPQHSPIHPGRVLTTFTFLSTAVEALNGNGAANTANTSLSEYTQNTGKALLKAALLLQLFIVMCFLALTATFHRRCRKAGIKNAKLENALLTLYISSGLITARTVYRTVEYFSIAQINFTAALSGGGAFDPNGFAPEVRYEWFFYVFEASLMLCNSVLYNVRHPGRYLPESSRIRLSDDGVTEFEGERYCDPRPCWMTVLDPFNVSMICLPTGFWANAKERRNARKEEEKRETMMEQVKV